MSITTATRHHSPIPSGAPASVVAWVEEVAALTLPDDIVWCTGTAAEYDSLTRQMV